MDAETNGPWRFLPPERRDAQEFSRNARKNKIIRRFATLVLVALLLAVGQSVLVACAGLGVMNFSEVTIGILAGSVPIELLLTMRMVVMKVIESDS